MCTRLVRKMFFSEKIKRYLLYSAEKRRFPNKYYLYDPKSHQHDCEEFFFTKFRNPKKHRNIILAFSLLTSMWYETNKNDVEDNVGYLITLAKIALERGDSERAEDILHLCLQISEEHKLHTTVPVIYDILTKIAIGIGDLPKAQELCVTAIEKLTMWGYAEDDYNIIDFKLKLARIYSSSDNERMAKLGFDTCLKQQQGKIVSGDTSEKTGILYITILFWYGVHLIKQNNYVTAKSLINTAYEYSTKFKGLSVKQEMIILYMLSNVHTELGDYESALTCMLNATILGKSISSIDLPLCYMKLGYIYEQMGNIQEAKFAYEEASKYAKMYGFFDILIDAEDALNALHYTKND